MEKKKSGQCDPNKCSVPCVSYKHDITFKGNTNLMFEALKHNVDL